MKQKDIALIVVIVIISAVMSFFVSKKIFVTPKSRQQKVADVQVIQADFPNPDSRFFNSSSIDPTKIITIGPSNNSAPFNSSTNTAH